MSDELDKFQEKGFEKFPNNKQGVEQVVFMVRDMMNVLRDAGDHEVAFAFGKPIQVNVFSHKHYNICLLSTTLSRSMKVADNMIDKTQADFEGKSEDHYNDKHKKPAVIPENTKPRSDSVDTANELAAEFAVQLLRWYFRIGHSPFNFANIHQRQVRLRLQYSSPNYIIKRQSSYIRIHT